MKPYDDMNGVEVLWYLMSHWDAGKGLWFIIGLAVVAMILSLICDKYIDDSKVTHIDYWGQNR